MISLFNVSEEAGWLGVVVILRKFEMVRVLIAGGGLRIVFNISLQSNVSDKWLWRHDSCGGYSVWGAYKVFTTTDSQSVEAFSDLIWHKQVFLKVYILAWMLLCNRLPTKDNLVTRNIISHDPQVCVTECGSLETTSTCSSCVPFSPLCGACLDIGLVYIQLIRSCYMIYCSVYSCFWWITCTPIIPATYLLSGLCGVSGIIEFSEQRKVQITRC
jgi:hypothetical protein